MEVIQATTKHLKQLVTVRIDFLKELHLFSHEDEQELVTKLTAFFESHLNKELFCYVIEKEEQIISSVFVLTAQKLPINSEESGIFGTVLNGYTHPSYRKRGFSKKIVEKVTKEACRMKLDKLVLSATESGYPLYKQLGFKEKKEKYVSMQLSFIDFE